MRTYSLYIGFEGFDVEEGKTEFVDNPFLFGAEKDSIEAVIEENPILKFLTDEDVAILYGELNEAEKLFREEPDNSEFGLDDAYAELGGIWCSYDDNGIHYLYGPDALKIKGVTHIAITARER